MFGQWRLTLRQAEEAVRSERFEEALELASRPELADHRRALKLRDRIAGGLVERAREHLRCGHSQAAWKDLREAELAGAPAGKLEHLRAALLEHGLAEMRVYLEARNPQQAVALAEKLKLRGADSPELRRVREGAMAWQRALNVARAGDFSRAIRCLETVPACLGADASLGQTIKSLKAEWERAVALRGQFQHALAAQEWAAVLKTTEAILELAPDCRETRVAREEALRRLGVPVLAGPSTGPATLDDTQAMQVFGEVKSVSRDRFILWIDGVGGYLVCLAPVVTVGQAAPGCTVDIPILGDLSRMHATFARDGEGYLVRSDRELSVNGRVVKQALLRHGDRVRLGRTVEFRFEVPCPVSETARLQLTSRHRLHLSLAGILLMAEASVLGPSPQANVQIPQAPGQVVIYRQGGGLWCRADGVVEIDGQSYQGRGPLRLSSRATVGEVSFSLEPLGSPLNQV